MVKGGKKMRRARKRMRRRSRRYRKFIKLRRNGFRVP